MNPLDIRTAFRRMYTAELNQDYSQAGDEAVAFLYEKLGQDRMEELAYRCERADMDIMLNKVVDDAQWPEFIDWVMSL